MPKLRLTVYRISSMSPTKFVFGRLATVSIVGDGLALGDQVALGVITGLTMSCAGVAPVGNITALSRDALTNAVTASANLTFSSSGMGYILCYQFASSVRAFFFEFRVFLLVFLLFFLNDVRLEITCRKFSSFHYLSYCP